MPHCIQCGAPLNIDGAIRPAWKDSLRDASPGTRYLRTDEFGQMERLAELSGVPVPAGLSGLRSRPVLHRDVIDPEEILPYVLRRTRSL